MADHWEAAPRHMMRLDIRSLLQDAAIEEVSVLWLKSHLLLLLLLFLLLWNHLRVKMQTS